MSTAYTLLTLLSNISTEASSVDPDQGQSDPGLDILIKHRPCMYVCAMKRGYTRYWITI